MQSCRHAACAGELHILHLFTVLISSCSHSALVHGAGCGSLNLKSGAGFLDFGDVVDRGLDISKTADGSGTDTCCTG